MCRRLELHAEVQPGAGADLALARASSQRAMRGGRMSAISLTPGLKKSRTSNGSSPSQTELAADALEAVAAAP